MSLEPVRAFPRRLLEVVSGTRSLMVRHTVQRKTFKSLGHRTVESQVMHLPVIRSRSAALVDLFGTDCAGLFEAAHDGASREVSAAIAVDEPSRFFLLGKMEGNWWLMDRPCLEGCCKPSLSWICEAARSPVTSTGMFDAFSRTSASES